MSSIIDEICVRMSRFPQAEIDHGDSWITYYPASPDGFVVRLVVTMQAAQERFLVYYGGSRQEEQGRDGSIIDFGFGLSNGCRLREFSRNGEAYRWITDIDSFVKGWSPYWETYRFSGAFWRFWQRRSVQCLQNQLIDLDAGPAAASCRLR
jgi:hypothetical protein